MKKIYHIICEGKSEVSYIERLNRFFDNNDINCSFKTYNLRGVVPVKDKSEKSSYTKILNIYRNEVLFSKEKGELVILWLDDDMFIEKTLNKDRLRSQFSKECGNNQIIFCYNYENFEDFLVMHLEEDVFLSYYRECDAKQHFKKPLRANEYSIIMEQYAFKNYNKGKLPDNFIIDENSLKNASERNNNNNYKCSCDLLRIIMKEISKINQMS
jgi:hypothetical protein